MRRLQLPIAVVLVGLAGSVGVEAPAWALDAEDALRTAQQKIATAAGETASIQTAMSTPPPTRRTPEQRLSDAKLLLEGKDFTRAATVLSQIVEESGDAGPGPEARFLLGETYFRSKQYLSARRAYGEILKKSGDANYGKFQANAVGRLADVALRLRDPQLLEEVSATLAQASGAASGSILQYARGKVAYAKKDFATAKNALGGVDLTSGYGHQARYMLALITTKESASSIAIPTATGAAPPDAAPVPNRYAAAIDQFLQVTRLSGDTPEQRHVVDLSWMAIGRLQYESGQYEQAAESYGHVDRTSPEFSTMLYELAWVYVRLGDYDRAERSLEIIAIVDPSNLNLADGSLLRADLMLRAGRYEPSLKTYEGVRDTFDPMRERVDAFLGSTSDPAVYYDRLSQQQLESLETATSLPPIALQWAREAEDGPLAFAVLDDVNECRELLKTSNELVDKINALLGSPNRVRAFPELRAATQTGVSLLNRIGLARLSLGQGLDDVDSRPFSGELAAARTARRGLEARLARVPVTDADFAARDDEATRQWNGVSQATQRLTLEVDYLQASVNALRKLMGDGRIADKASQPAYEAELVRTEADLELYRSRLDQTRKDIAAGRVQVGFGDQRYIDDADTRKAYRDALVKETELLAGGAAGPGEAQAYAARVLPVLREADASDAKIEAALAVVEAEVARRVAGLQETVSKETANIVGYQVRLNELDGQSRVVIGEVAMRNFGLVRDRLKSIVLRADVGITQEAWEVREEHMRRVREWQVERAREERVLKQELNEVLDDGAGEENTK